MLALEINEFKFAIYQAKFGKIISVYLLYWQAIGSLNSYQGSNFASAAM